MVGIARPGETLPVTSLTINRSSRKFVPLFVDMASAAIGDGMHAHQRESLSCMKIEQVLAILPVIRGMAILAGDPELSSMNIGVAIGAGGGDMGEFQVLMARGATGAFMGAQKRESGFLVPECHRLTDIGPG